MTSINFVIRLILAQSWYYVSTKVNPADLPTHKSDTKCLQKMICIGMVQKLY